MNIILIDATDRAIGTIDKENNVFTLKGKKLCEVKPKITIKEIIKLIKISLMLEKAEEKQ